MLSIHRKWSNIGRETTFRSSNQIEWHHKMFPDPLWSQSLCVFPFSYVVWNVDVKIKIIFFLHESHDSITLWICSKSILSTQNVAGIFWDRESYLDGSFACSNPILLRFLELPCLPFVWISRYRSRVFSKYPVASCAQMKFIYFNNIDRILETPFSIPIKCGINQQTQHICFYDSFFFFFIRVRCFQFSQRRFIDVSIHLEYNEIIMLRSNCINKLTLWSHAQNMLCLPSPSHQQLDLAIYLILEKETSVFWKPPVLLRLSYPHRLHNCKR